MEKSFNPIKLAIENYNYIYSNVLKNAIEKEKLPNIETSTRARSREVLSLIQELGLLGVLSLYYGKAEKENYDSLIEILEGREKEEKKLFSKTEAGYAVILYLILKGIESLNIVKIDCKKPYEAINELSKKENLSKISVIEKLLIPYMIEIKRLCEGTLRSK